MQRSRYGSLVCVLGGGYVLCQCECVSAARFDFVWGGMEGPSRVPFIRGTHRWARAWGSMCAGLSMSSDASSASTRASTWGRRTICWLIVIVGLVGV
jgi:hypothetical protein